MKVYLAARFSDKESIAVKKKELQEAGVEVTSTWTEEENAPNAVLDDFRNQTLAKYAIRDLREVEEADAVVLFTVDPTTATYRGGRHVEFGYGLGKGKMGIVVGPKENIFHYPKSVSVFPTWEEAKTFLVGA